MRAEHGGACALAVEAEEAHIEFMYEILGIARSREIEDVDTLDVFPNGHSYVMVFRRRVMFTGCRFWHALPIPPLGLRVS